jgi:GNAT superfamily N-acetyltransferase
VRNRLRVRRADTSDVTSISDIIAEAGQALAEKGFRNWATPYSIERIESDLIAREVYVIEQNAKPVGTYMLGGTAVHPYDPPPWPWPDARALYLNRMAVSPRLQGRGIGSFALEHIAVRARQQHVEFVRCDVLEANLRLRSFYERHGYMARGTRMHSGWHFVCYECSFTETPAHSPRS